MKTRWNLTVPEETNEMVRTYLAKSGAKKGALSRFVNDAVMVRLLEITLERIKKQNPNGDQQEMLNAINQALHEVRTRRV